MNLNRELVHFDKQWKIRILNTRNFLVAFLLLLTSTMDCSRRQIKVESPVNSHNIELVLEMKDFYENDDTISPKVIITNRSKVPLTLAKPLYPFTLHFIVRDTLGKDISTYLIVDYAFKNLEDNVTQPNASITESVSDLKDIYRFKPGVYNFQAVYGVAPEPDKRTNFTLNRPNKTYELFTGYVHSNWKTVHIGKLKFKFPE